MEYAARFVSSEYIEDLCYKSITGSYEVYPHLLPYFKDNKPPIIINKCYIPFIDPSYKECHKKHQHLMGGAGSGKSRFIATKYLLKAQCPEYFRLLFVRKFKNSIQKSVYQLFKDLIDYYGWTYKFRCNESTYDIRCLLTGHSLFAAGLDDVGKLMSIQELTDIWIEEPVAEETKNNVTMKDYTELLRRLRTNLAETHICCTYNPINKASFLYTKFFKTKVYKDADVAILRTTYKDNPFLPQDFIQMLEDLVDVNEDEAQVFTYGRWGEGDAKNRWIRTYKSARHVSTDNDETGYIPNYPVDLIYDFNVVPYMPMLCAQSIYRYKMAYDYRAKKKIYKQVLEIRYFREYALPNPNNSAEAVTRKFVHDYVDPTTGGFGPIPVDYYGDATGDYGVPGVGSRDVASRYIPIRNVLTENNLIHNDSKKVMTSNPYLVDQRELVEDVLAGKYDIDIVIDEQNCPELIEDLSSTQEGVHGFDKAKDKKGVEHRGHYISCISAHLCSKFRHLLKLRGMNPEDRN